MFDYAGCIHFHSAYSYDARIPLPDILTEAQQTGLDYAIVADHFRMDAREDGYEGYASPGNPPSPEGRGTSAAQGEAKSVLLIVGEEISPRYNHYLALNLQTPIVTWKTETRIQRVIDEVNAQGGFGFISHPDHGGAPLFGSRAYPWIQWDAQGYAGLGIWDLMSDWSSALSTPLQAFAAFARPSRALRGPKRETLARWDQLTQKGHCVAIGEIDNHGHFRSFWGIKRQLFPFAFAFRTIRTHVLLEKPLTKNAREDIPTVLDALRQGQSYVSLDLWNDPKGFHFTAYDQASRAWPGGQLTRQGQAIIEIRLPKPGRIVLLRDGRPIKEEHRRAALLWDLDLPGVYRVEAQQWVGGAWRPWIYSNPIWIK